jgi:hypothetical protein
VHRVHRKNVFEWSDGEYDLGIEITEEGIEVYGFTFGGGPDEPGEHNIDIGPGFVSWNEIEKVRREYEE